MITFLISLPPPLHGMSMINACMEREIKEHSTGESRTFNMVPSRFSKYFPGKLWSLLKLLHLLTLLPLFLLHTITKGKDGNLYFSISGGFGKWLELPYILVAAPFYKKIFIHHHSFAYCNQFHHSMNIIHLLIRHKAVHICLCKKMQQHLNEQYGISTERTYVLSNLSFLEKNAQNEPQKEHLTTIGFLGNITKEKGIEEFLEVAEWLSKNHPETSAIIAGPCHDPSLLDRLNRYKDHASIKYLGPIYGEEKEAFFNDISLLLFPTSYINEAQPVTIYEAFIHDVPVIAWLRGGIESMIRQGAGLGIPSEQKYIPETTSYIEKLIEDPLLYKSLIMELRKNILAQINEEKDSLEKLVGMITT